MTAFRHIGRVGPASAFFNTTTEILTSPKNDVTSSRYRKELVSRIQCNELFKVFKITEINYFWLRLFILEVTPSNTFCFAHPQH